MLTPQSIREKLQFPSLSLIRDKKEWEELVQSRIREIRIEGESMDQSLDDI